MQFIITQAAVDAVASTVAKHRVTASAGVNGVAGAVVADQVVARPGQHRVVPCSTDHNHIAMRSTPDHGLTGDDCGFHTITGGSGGGSRRHRHPSDTESQQAGSKYRRGATCIGSQSHCLTPRI